MCVCVRETETESETDRHRQRQRQRKDVTYKQTGKITKTQKLTKNGWRPDISSRRHNNSPSFLFSPLVHTFSQF